MISGYRYENFDDSAAKNTAIGSTELKQHSFLKMLLIFHSNCTFQMGIGWSVLYFYIVISSYGFL